MSKGGRPLTGTSRSTRKAKTLLEGARKLGIPYSRAKRLRLDGWQTDSRGLLDLDEGRKLLESRSARAPDSAGSFTGEAITYKERLLKAKALREEMELAVYAKTLVAKSDVRRVWGMQTTKISNSLKGVGRALAPLIAHKGPIECQAVIDRRILEILNDLKNSDYGPQG